MRDHIQAHLRQVADEIGWTVVDAAPEGNELPTVTVVTEDGVTVRVERYLPVAKPGTVVSKLYRLNWNKPYGIPTSTEENGDAGA